MPEISAAVGRGAPNTPTDVRTVQELLIRHRRWLDGAQPPQATGQFDDATATAITGFQKDGAALANQDGRVDPRGFTLSRLNLASIPGPQHRAFLDMCWNRLNEQLSDADFTGAATRLNCEVAAIRAVFETETAAGAWDDLGRPKILFERHKFARHSGNRFNGTHPDISNTQRGGFGPSSRQYGRMRRAAMLDEAAALKAASWGAFQILGENFSEAGHPNVDAFVTAMLAGMREHLAAFVSFVNSSANLRNAIRNRDWAAFARGYNGPAYAENDYDGKMARAYARLSGATR